MIAMIMGGGAAFLITQQKAAAMRGVREQARLMVSASTEEVNVSAEEIAGTARGLAGMAWELQTLVGRFKL